MPYTQADLDDLDQAIRDIRDGKRVDSQSAGEASQAFANPTIDSLLKLRPVMELDIANTTPVGEVRLRGKPRLFLMRFKRGL